MAHHNGIWEHDRAKKKSLGTASECTKEGEADVYFLMTMSLLQEIIKSTGDFPLPDAEAVQRLSQADKYALYMRQQDIIAMFQERAALHLSSMRYRLLQLNNELRELEQSTEHQPVKSQISRTSDIVPGPANKKSMMKRVSAMQERLNGVLQPKHKD
jgi:hypothetical protein